MSRDFQGDDVTHTVTSPGMDPLVGQVLDGRFRVVEAIGTGGMGRVYRAVQQPLNRAVALKVLDYNYGAGRDESFRQRFLVEAALTAKLTHPNTITVIDYGCTPNGIFYIAMEYLDGRTLDQVVQDEGPLEWRRVLSIGQQVCRSLKEAHNLGVVHRDLKPANIMLLHADDDTDQVKVLDFGLVKSFVVGQELEGRAVTEQGMLMGSPPYMAPEQGEKNHADPRSDIYSLGTVLYEALTGAPPFTGKNPMEVILKHVHQAVPPMRVPGAEPVPPEMEALVVRCLAKSPMDRFQSMDEVLQAMQELSMPQHFATPTGGIPVQSGEVPVPAAAAAAPRAGTSRLFSVLLFVVAVVLGGIVATFAIRQFKVAPLTAPAEPVPEPEPVAVVRPPPPANAPPPQELIVAPPEKREPVVEEPEPPPPPEPVAVKPPEPKPEPKPEPAPVVKVKALPPPPANVVFRVETDPRGALVTLEGKPVGRSPIDVTVAIPPSGTAHAELGLSLKGYEPTTISASGQSGRVLVKEKLKAAGAPKKKAAASPQVKPGKAINSSAKLSDDDDDAVKPSPPPAGDLKKPAP